MICLFSCLPPVLVKCGLAVELVIIPFLSYHVLASVCRVFATAQHLDFLLQCLSVCLSVSIDKNKVQRLAFIRILNFRSISVCSTVL